VGRAKQMLSVKVRVPLPLCLLSSRRIKGRNGPFGRRAASMTFENGMFQVLVLRYYRRGCNCCDGPCSFGHGRRGLGDGVK
jgi:hypothetical protein